MQGKKRFTKKQGRKRVKFYETNYISYYIYISYNNSKRCTVRRTQYLEIAKQVDLAYTG